MTTARIVNCSPYGMTCTECDRLLIAPKQSEYVSEEQVRHLWSCDSCGHEIELAVNLRFDAASQSSRFGTCPVSLVV
jgi:RNase P subunit RPR2